MKCPWKPRSVLVILPSPAGFPGVVGRPVCQTLLSGSAPVPVLHSSPGASSAGSEQRHWQTEPVLKKMSLLDWSLFFSTLYKNRNKTTTKKKPKSKLSLVCLQFLLLSLKDVSSQNNIFLMTLCYWKNGYHLIPVKVWLQGDNKQWQILC